MKPCSCRIVVMRLSITGFGLSLMLEIKDGTLSIGGHQLFSNLSFCTAEGGLTAVTGPHGCGKTSLLRAFLGFQPLDSGYVSVDAEPVLPHTSALFRAGMLYVPQDIRLCAGSFSEVFESLEGLHVNAALDHARKKLFYEWKRLALDSSMYAMPLEELDGSALRRMMISVAGVTGRKNVLLDEPFAGHDADTLPRVMSYLRALAASGSTVLLATVDSRLAGMCDVRIELGV